MGMKSEYERVMDHLNANGRCQSGGKAKPKLHWDGGWHIECQEPGSPVKCKCRLSDWDNAGPFQITLQWAQRA
jgi:hypothetical protein